MYALIGVLLLLFYNNTPKSTLGIALALLGISVIFNGLTYLLPSINTFLDTTLIHNNLSQYNFLKDLVQKIVFRFNFFNRVAILNAIYYTPEILSLFLFGLYAGKIKFFNSLEEFDSNLKKAQIISLILSLICFIPMITLYISSSSYQLESAYFFVWLSGKTMAVFYISTILLLFKKEKWQKRLKPFSYVGKMALTNYIGQTFFTIIIFSILFKNTAIIPLCVGVLYCPLFYIIQVKLSKWWLFKHSMGPLELVWRYATYFSKDYKIEKNK